MRYGVDPIIYAPLFLYVATNARETMWSFVQGLQMDCSANSYFFVAPNPDSYFERKSTPFVSDFSRPVSHHFYLTELICSLSTPMNEIGVCT